MSAECEKMTSEKSLEEKLGEMKSGTEIRPRSPVSSCVSFKSDQSLPLPLNFKGGTVTHESGTEIRPRSPVSSCVSFKSDQSLPLPLNFKGGTVTHERITKQSSKIIYRNSLESIFKMRGDVLVIISMYYDVGCGALLDPASLSLTCYRQNLFI